MEVMLLSLSFREIAMQWRFQPREVVVSFRLFFQAPKVGQLQWVFKLLFSVDCRAIRVLVTLRLHMCERSGQ